MNSALSRYVLLVSVVAAWTVVAQDAKEFKGRLPAYYSGVVTEGQRREIYKIQERYAVRIDELKAQLEALEQERDDEIEAVLTKAQRERVQKAREDAADKRKKPAVAKAAK